MKPLSLPAYAIHFAACYATGITAAAAPTWAWIPALIAAAVLLASRRRTTNHGDRKP